MPSASPDLGRDMTAPPISSTVEPPASPVPPPLPRRAARRAAPVPSGESPASHPKLTTDSAADTVKSVKAEPPNATSASEPPMTTTSHDEIDIPQTTEPASITPDTPRAIEALSTAKVQPRAGPEESQDTLVTSETQPVDGKENETSAPSQESEPSPRNATDPPPQPSDDQQGRASGFSDLLETSPHHTSVSTGHTHGDELEVYIGDTTWEERTWKVLVRLREDMFYARLGSVR